MENPLVSVIIPNYNHAKFLRQRIDSVLNQTYKKFEVIILDDNSTDNSKEIIEQYRKNKSITHILYNAENSGSTFRQWQKGISLAKGDIIWIAESDDTCEEELLFTLVSEFKKNSDCVIAFCRSVKIDEVGNPIGEEGLGEDMHIDGRLFIKNYLSRHNYVTNASSALFRKETLSSIDWAYSNLRGCGDWIIWTEIASQGMCVYINKPMNYFRIHKKNTTKEQTFNGNNEIEGTIVYQYMRKKHYIGYKEELRARISHIYSVKYGKQSSFYTKEIKKDILTKWRNNICISIFTWVIYIIQSFSHIQIIKR